MAKTAVEAPTETPTRRRRGRRGVKQGGMKAYLYLAPTLIVLIVFVYFPIAESFRLSLNRVAPFGSAEIFVGLEHYTRLLQSSEFWNNVMVSVFFMLGTVPVGIGLALGIALLLSYPVRRLAWAHRTLVFVPVIISSAIAGVLFRWLYNPVVGHINTWLGAIGIDGPDWLTSRTWALFAVTVAVVWRQLGFNVIIALAGLQQIDDVYYEAAKVDGANTWHRIRYITIPLMSPTLLFLLVINIIISFQAFGEIDILTQGGPGQATENLVYSVFVDGFVGTRFRGLASAQAFLLAIMIIAVSFIQFRGIQEARALRMTAFDPEAVDVLVETSEEEAPPRARRSEPLIHFALFFIGALVALPIVVAIFTSFTPLSQILSDPNSIWSAPWTLQNYVTAWTATPFGRFMLNSFVQTGLITLAQVLFSILAAYAFAMFRFPGRNVMFAIVLGSLMVPFELTFIPNFVLISNLGWANTYQGLVIPFLASAFGVFMLRQFFMALPRDLYDAAKIDGATDWYYLWKVVVPLSKGAISALTIFSFLGAWNQYLWPLVITNEESMRTAQIGIRFFLVNQERATDWGAIMAGATIVMLPTLLVFLVAQKQLVKGIAMSGLKG